MTKADLLAVAKPILFNTRMVQAILDGRKTQTRRLLKLPKTISVEPDGRVICAAEGTTCYFDSVGEFAEYFKLSQYQRGDYLYVRETWAAGCMGGYIYKAGHEYADRLAELHQWRPSIHMPKDAARLFLRVTAVRAERLQEITPDGIDAEGCKEYGYSADTGALLPSSPTLFKIRWDDCIKPADRARCGWAANPWVWVYEFERVEIE